MHGIAQVIFFSGILFWGCNSSSSHVRDAVSDSTQQTEIITKSYSVILQDGKAQKDTINMIQSMIVDIDGKELENRYYNLDGSASWSDVYEYDDSGYKSGSRYFDDSGTQTAYYEYDLDSLGRRIAYRAKDVNTDTLLYQGASSFLDNGKIRRDGFVSKSGEFKYNFEYQYDEDGQELGYIYINLGNGDRFPAQFRYTKFNDQDEWLEREIVENELVTGIEVREFRELE